MGIMLSKSRCTLNHKQASDRWSSHSHQIIPRTTKSIIRNVQNLKSAGGNSSFELHSQSMEERATLDRYHHFHGHSGMCT